MRKIFYMISLLTLCVFAAGCGGKTSGESGYVLKIGGSTVGESEFKLYLYEAQQYFIEKGGQDIWDTDFNGRTAEEVAKDGAINTIKMVKLAMQKSKDMNITLTDDEIKKAEEDGDLFLSGLSGTLKSEINASKEDVYRTMQEKAVFVKVYNSIIQQYSLDEDEFSAYFEPDAKEYASIYTKINVQEAIFDTKEAAEKAASLGKDGDFTEKVKELGFESYESQYYKGEMENMLGITFDLEPGETSGVIETQAGYYVFKLIDTETPDEEATREFVKGIYVYNNSQEYFNNELEKWTNDASIEINQKAVDNIKLSIE